MFSSNEDSKTYNYASKLGNVQFSKSSVEELNTLARTGPASWVCNLCSHMGLHTWFNALLQPL